MGQNCSCLSNVSTDDKQLRLDGPVQMENNPKINLSGNLKLNEFKITLEDIIKLQSLLRGYLDRKTVKKIYSTKPKEETHKLQETIEIGTHNLLKRSINNSNDPVIRIHLKDIPQSQVPDYLTDATKETLHKLGPLKIDKDTSDGVDLVNRGPVEIENGSVYTGSWNQDNQRHGFGLQI